MFNSNEYAYDPNDSKWIKCCKWIVNHKEVICFVAAVTPYVIKKSTKMYHKYLSNHPKEIFDPTLGINMPLKRHMTNYDKLYYSRLVDMGYTRHQALKYAGLI